MDNWQTGDLALCVRGGTLTRPGAVYIVSEVLIGPSREGGRLWRRDETGLRFHGMRFPVGQTSRATRFRKINPLTDEERRYALRDLDAPVRERVS